MLARGYDAMVALRWWTTIATVMLALAGAGCARPAVDMKAHEAGSDDPAAEFQRDWLPRMILIAG